MACICIRGRTENQNKQKSSAIGVFIGIILMFLITALVPVIVAAFQSWFDNDAQEYLSLFANVI